MGTHNMVDIPGGVKFFHGFGPAPVLGRCQHDCEHRHLSVIAWGPDWRRYELLTCDMRDGCDGQCRGWKRVTSYDDNGTVATWWRVGEQTPLYGEEQTVVEPIGGRA